MNNHWKIKEELKEINELVNYYVAELGQRKFHIDSYLRGYAMYLIDQIEYIPDNYSIVPFTDLDGTGIDFLFKNNTTQNMICVEILSDLTTHASIFRPNSDFSAIFENDVEANRINELIEEYIR